MIGQGIVLGIFQEWLTENVPVLNSKNVEVHVGENLDSAGSDPILWADFFAGSRGARLALWRADEMELDRDDLEVDKVFAPEHFSNQEGFFSAINALLSWISGGLSVDSQ